MDSFGYSVSISGDRVVVGAYLATFGAAYIFERNQGGNDNWGETQKIMASNSDHFGYSVDFAGGTLVIGDNSASGNNNTGSAYVFEESTAIPASSEGGMIIFFVLLLGSGLWVIRRKQKQKPG